MADAKKESSPGAVDQLPPAALARGSGAISMFDIDSPEIVAMGTDPGTNFLAPLEEAAHIHTGGLSEPHPLHDDPMTLERCFERALRSMYMCYQPIVWARAAKTLFGHEALLRPNDPEIPHPGAMIDAAHRLDRLQQLGRAIRLRVAELFAHADAIHGLIFVNLHATDLLDSSLMSRFAPLAKIAHRVVLEITESSSLEVVSNVRHRVQELRSLGYQIAIDDFGAGHSRMKLVSPVDTDFVKLDMSLVRDIEQHIAKQQLVTSITHLCHDQGIKVIGEGVETEAEARVLIELGCDLLQGYLIARPSASLVIPQ